MIQAREALSTRQVHTSSTTKAGHQGRMLAHTPAANSDSNSNDSNNSRRLTRKGGCFSASTQAPQHAMHIRSDELQHTRQPRS